MKKMKYQLIALSSLILYFYFVPQLLAIAWPQNINSRILLISTAYLAQLFYIGTLLAVHTFAYTIGNLYYYVFYHMEHKYFEQFKVEKRPWPWHEDKLKWKQTLKLTFCNLAINFIGGAILGLIESSFGLTKSICQEQTRIVFLGILRWHGRSYLVFFWKILCSIGPTAYYIPQLFIQGYISNIMITIQLYVVVSISAEYSHPIEYILGNILPVLAGPKLLGLKMHLATLHVWLCFRILKTLSAHSGYLFPWEPFSYIPYGTNADFHSFHHSHNSGNFGSAFVFWDRIFNTDIIYQVSIALVFQHVQKMKKEKKFGSSQKFY